MQHLMSVQILAVNNQGYSCRVDFAGTQTPTSACDVSTEGECSALGANICIWVDRVSPDKHSSTINGRNCANPTHAPDSALQMFLNGQQQNRFTLLHYQNFQRPIIFW